MEDLKVILFISFVSIIAWIILGARQIVQVNNIPRRLIESSTQVSGNIDEEFLIDLYEESLVN